MKILLLLAVLVASPCIAQAAAYCERMPLDPEAPAGLEGSYEIIGKDPATGSSYSADLVLRSGKTTYAITRTANGKIVHGDAWMEACGADKIQFLVGHYGSKPVTRLSCRLGVDGDNYYRATCRSSQDGVHWRGLEAWFQVP